MNTLTRRDAITHTVAIANARPAATRWQQTWLPTSGCVQPGDLTKAPGLFGHVWVGYSGRGLRSGHFGSRYLSLLRHYISRGVDPGERGSWICTCSCLPSLFASAFPSVLGASSVPSRSEGALSVSVSVSALVSMLACVLRCGVRISNGSSRSMGTVTAC